MQEIISASDSHSKRYNNGVKISNILYDFRALMEITSLDGKQEIGGRNNTV